MSFRQARKGCFLFLGRVGASVTAITGIGSVLNIDLAQSNETWPIGQVFIKLPSKFPSGVEGFCRPLGDSDNNPKAEKPTLVEN